MNIKRLVINIYRFFCPIDSVTMYRRMGVAIGKNCKIQGGVIIDYSHYWHITIGENVTIAPCVHILAHDASTKLHLGYTKIGKVDIGNNVFIGAGSIILPGVSIGENSIIGAGSIVNRNIPDNSVAVGNPAKVVSNLDEFLNKNKKLTNKYPQFGDEYTLRENISDKMKHEMNILMEERIGFVK